MLQPNIPDQPCPARPQGQPETQPNREQSGRQTALSFSSTCHRAVGLKGPSPHAKMHLTLIVDSQVWYLKRKWEWFGDITTALKPIMVPHVLLLKTVFLYVCIYSGMVALWCSCLQETTSESPAAASKHTTAAHLISHTSESSIMWSNLQYTFWNVSLYVANIPPPGQHAGEHFKIFNFSNLKFLSASSDFRGFLKFEK